MTGPRPRRRNEPVWCVKDDHRPGPVRRHVSEPVQAGEQHRGGQVTVWLVQGDDGPQHVLVNVAHGASASVEIDLEAARAFRDGLTYLIDEADRSNG